MDAVLEIHTWYRWVVLAVLLGVGIFGMARASRGATWSEGSDRPFTLATIIFDLQLAIGIVLWIGNKGWNQDFFIQVIHPAGMLIAAGVAHLALVRARSSSVSRAYFTAGVGLLAALIIVALSVPRYSWF